MRSLTSNQRKLMTDYIGLHRRNKALKDQLELHKDSIIKIVKVRGGEIPFAGAKIKVEQTSTYEYSPKLTAMGAKLDALRAQERSDGTATATKKDKLVIRETE